MKRLGRHQSKIGQQVHARIVRQVNTHSRSIDAHTPAKSESLAFDHRILLDIAFEQILRLRHQFPSRVFAPQHITGDLDHILPAPAPGNFLERDGGRNR